MTELNEIISRYATLVEVMNKLESEVPEIQKIHKELNLAIKNQSKIANTAIESIKKQTESSLNDIDNATGKTNELLDKISVVSKAVSDAEKRQSELMSELENKSKEIQALLNQRNGNSSDLSVLMRRITSLESRIDRLEKNGVPSNNSNKTPSSILKPSINIYPSSKSKFPADSQYFNLNKIQNVSGKKPYGIAIEGSIIKVPFWTSMLDEVVPYIIDKYSIDCKDLICSEYAKIIPPYGIYEGREIPYFIEGISEDYDGQKYRPVKKHNLSVYYGGATDVVDLLNKLLIDYLMILPENVEVFYHNK